MSNHYQLLIETPEGNLVAGIRRLNGVYTQTFNRRHCRVEHVLQGRYKSIVVDKDAYHLELVHYIVLNPVRAKMVERAEDWPWSSYPTTAGKTQAADWLEADWIVKQFGEDTAAARQAYRRFVQAGVEGPSPWQQLRGQIYLGEETFLARVEKLAAEQNKEGVPASHRRPARPEAEAVLLAVAKAFGVTAEAVRNRSRQPAFRAWVYLLRRAANLSLREAAQCAGVSPVRISQIQRAAEIEKPAVQLVSLMQEYKVKACPFFSLLSPSKFFTQSAPETPSAARRFVFLHINQRTLPSGMRVA
jgi:hypothetical protein